MALLILLTQRQADPMGPLPAWYGMEPPLDHLYAKLT
jgi:hypothetical protein